MNSVTSYSGVIIATVLRSRASGIPHIVAPAFEAASRFNALGRALALEGLDQYRNTSFCALSEGHGVFCWGAVTRGIGGGIEMREVHFPASVALLSVSELEACVVTTNGQVLCANAPVFGDGRVWQVFDRGGWTDVAVHWDTVCAIDQAGRVFCRTGVHTSGAAAGPVFEIPVRAPAVKLGNQCAILVDGTLECWTCPDQLRPEACRVDEIAAPGAVGAVGTSDNFACMMLVDGRVFCWGSNNFGQLGIGTMGAPRVTPQEVVRVQEATHITVSLDNACALTRSGAAFCWEKNTYG